MFNGFSANTIEKGRSSLENTGTRLESEFIGEVDTTEYKKLAYEFLHKDEINKIKNSSISPDEKFEKLLGIKESAQKDFDNVSDMTEKGKYIDFENSVKLVEQSQIGNPEKPSRLFSSALLKSIKDLFAEKYIIKFFTATGGTHLDIAHGVDGFFKLYDKESGEEKAMATIDLTKNSSKDKARADVLIYIDKDEIEKYDSSKNNKNFDKKFFDEKIEKFSKMITQALVENYQSR